MILMGSLGKNNAKRFLLGNVSEKIVEEVVRNAQVPVLIVDEKSLREG
ncbi:universal stress protein [Methanosarcina sp.]|nr:universal stress protein [Methanosarcina sp.]MDW5551334.1 universal stress protein [Methanosarcina sp.]MDW5555266.1 universal stress protein [Methanosarcina sp.]MDW5560921.1 universal stress protein [Methanosarcina sp.]